MKITAKIAREKTESSAKVYKERIEEADSIISTRANDGFTDALIPTFEKNSKAYNKQLSELYDAGFNVGSLDGNGNLNIDWNVY